MVSPVLLFKRVLKSSDTLRRNEKLWLNPFSQQLLWLVLQWLNSALKCFISEPYKIDLIFTLLFSTFSIVSEFSRFHSEVCHLREILKRTYFLSNW